MPRTATIIAAEPLDTLRIKKDQFLQMLREVVNDPAIEIVRENRNGMFETCSASALIARYTHTTC